MKSCPIKGLPSKIFVVVSKMIFFFNRKCQKKTCQKKLLILIASASIYVERFAGRVSDWSILNNDWPIQKFDLLTSMLRRLYHIAKN